MQTSSGFHDILGLSFDVAQSNVNHSVNQQAELLHLVELLRICRFQPVVGYRQLNGAKPVGPYRRFPAEWHENRRYVTLRWVKLCK